MALVQWSAAKERSAAIFPLFPLMNRSSTGYRVPRLDLFPDMLCMKRVYKTNGRRYTGQQQGTKSDFRPADKPRMNRGSTAGFVPPTVDIELPLFVLPKTRPELYSCIVSGVFKRDGYLLGEPSCQHLVLPVAVPTRLPAVRHPILNGQWYVRVLDSTSLNKFPFAHASAETSTTIPFCSWGLNSQSSPGQTAPRHIALLTSRPPRLSPPPPRSASARLATLSPVSPCSPRPAQFVVISGFWIRQIRRTAFLNIFAKKHFMSGFTIDLSSPKPGHTTGGSGRGAWRSGGAGSGRTGCQQNCPPRRQASPVPPKASKTRRLNISPETRTSEIPCKPMEEQNPRLTRDSSPVYPRFINRTRSALCSWLLTSGPTPFCLCKVFSCKACPGTRRPLRRQTSWTSPRKRTRIKRTRKTKQVSRFLFGWRLVSGFPAWTWALRWCRGWVVGALPEVSKNPDHPRGVREIRHHGPHWNCGLFECIEKAPGDLVRPHDHLTSQTIAKKKQTHFLMLLRGRTRICAFQINKQSLNGLMAYYSQGFTHGDLSFPRGPPTMIIQKTSGNWLCSRICRTVQDALFSQLGGLENGPLACERSECAASGCQG